MNPPSVSKELTEKIVMAWLQDRGFDPKSIKNRQKQTIARRVLKRGKR